MSEQLGDPYPIGSTPLSEQQRRDVLGPYHADYMPLPEDPRRRAIVEKHMSGEPLTIAEMMQAGRDETVKALGEHQVLPDHVYRAVGLRRWRRIRRPAP